jgi:hypothetical protein
LDPVEYVDVEPSQLDEEQKRAYLILVSLAYASDGDLDRARLRLGGMDLEEDAGAALAAAADEALAQGLSEQSVRALTKLALAFDAQPDAAMAFAGTLPSPPTSPPTATATLFILPPTATPSPTPTPVILTPTLSAEGSGTPVPTPRTDRFALVSLTATCNSDRLPGLLVVFVQDASGEDLPGIEFLVEWEEGQDSFFSGLKPEEGSGYADFTMTEGRAYRLRVVDDQGTPDSRASSEFEARQCTPNEDADPRLGGYQAIFRETS